jgi:hypothetical protein
MISDRPENAAGVAQDTDAWLTPGRFAILLAALIIACFPEVVAGFETFFFRDFAGFGYPLAFYHKESFWRGELPLWNPLNNCGLPFLAQWNTLALYPLSLFYLLFPLSWSLGVFCLLHLFLAGMGMYFLAHRWTSNRLAAAVAGVIFGFNGLTWHSLMWPNNISAFGWMPWVILTAEMAWAAGGGRRIALAALVGAMQMLAGAPEIILLTWCTAGSLWLAQFAGGGTPRARMAVRFAFVLALVAGLAAAQLLPFLELLGHSQRDTGFGDSQWAMPRTGWFNYLVPLFRLRPSNPGPSSQVAQYWTSSYYLGVGTIALALLAAWRARDRRTWVLMALAGFSLIMALGDNGFVYTWVKRVLPQIGFMRFPIKFIVLATFVIPLLAARAVAWLQTMPPAERPAERRKVSFLALGLLGLMAVISWLAWNSPKPPDNAAASYDMTGTLWNALSRAGFLVAILGCLLALREVNSSRLQQLLCISLLLLLWFDVFTHAPGLSPTVSRRVYEPDRIRQYLKWDTQLSAGGSRAMPTPTSVLKMQFRMLAKPQDDIDGRRLALFADYNLLDHAAKVDGFFSLYQREASALNVWLYTVTNGLTPLKDFMGVSHISESTHAGEWAVRDTSMPLITAGQEPIFAQDPVAYQGMISENFDPRNFVYLPPEARPLITATRRVEAKIISRQFSAQTVVAEVESSAPAMLVVAQSYYHPWHAYVDGQPVHLWRANYAFQALEVPAGRHQVKLAYEDRAFWCGAVISLASLLGCLGVLAFRRKQALPKPARAEAPRTEKV